MSPSPAGSDQGAATEQPVDILATPEAGGRAIRGGVLRVLGFGGGLLAALAAAPFLIRHLGVERFGEYVTVTSLMTIVAMVSDAGLTVVGVREYSVRDEEGRRRLMRNLSALRIIITTLGAAVAILFALAAGYDSELVWGTALAGAGLLLLVLQQAYSVPLSAQLRLGWVTALDLARQMLTSAAIITAVVLGAGLLTFFALPIPVGIAVLAATAILIRGEVPLRPQLDRDEWRALAKEALPVAIASTIGSFFYRVAILVMSVAATAEATGYFSASFRLIEVAITIPGLITAAAFPIVARAAVDDPERLAYSLQRLFDIALVVGALAALGVAFGARPAIAVLAGPDFEPSIEVLRIQSVVVGASFLVAVWATALWAMRRQRALAWANVLGVTLSGTLVALLVGEHGATGAAIAMAIAEVVLASAYAYAVMHDRPDLRPSLRLVPKVALATALAALTWLLPVPDIVIVGIAAAVYAGVLVAVRGIPEEVWVALRPYLRPRRGSPEPR